MPAVWLVAVLLVLLPGVAAGQTTQPFPLPGANQSTAPTQPRVLPGQIIPPSPADAGVLVNPRTPPSATIPSGPEVITPLPPSLEAPRPLKTFEFHPILGISEEYTDNFNLTPNNKVSNFRTGVTPGFFAALQTPFVKGNLSYTPLAFYDSSDDRADMNHFLTALLGWDVTPRLRLSVAEGFVDSDTPSSANRLNLRRGRDRFTSNVAGVTGDYLFEPFAAQAYYHVSLFSSDTDSTLTHTPGGSLSMALAKINLVTLGYEYLDSHTTVHDTSGSTTTSFPRPSEDSTITGHQVTATYSRDVRKDVTAGLTAVYAVRDQEAASGHSDFTRKQVMLFSNYVIPDTLILRLSLGVADVSGGSSHRDPIFITDSAITYFTGPASFRLAVERGFSETFGQGENFGVVETSSVSGSFAYRFTPLLSILAGAAYRETKFTGLGGGPSAQDQKTVSATASMTYQILRWLAATLDYTYTDTRSDDPTASYVENRVRFALTATFY